MEELQPADDQLAQSMPLTLHSKWGREDWIRRGGEIIPGISSVCVDLALTYDANAG